MNGIICIYKEKGMTSFDVVAAVRRIYNTKRVGHGGTLDPMAEGVLPVFVGNATKAVDFCPDDTKQYLAGFQFGITTDTQDITGKVLSTCDDYVSRNKMPMVERLFSGEQLQTPPMYSAVKVNGQRLYDLARKGEVVNRQPRKITVYEIKVTKYGYNSGEMLVTCSKGTYIRTLIHDIGQKLGTGAVMTSLVRTRSGVFKLEDCHRLAELEGKTEQELESLLMPLEKLYGQLPKAHLDEKQTELFRNGAELDADRIRFDTIYDKGYYIEGSDGVFLGLGKIGEKHQLEVMRRFKTEAAAAIEQAAKEQSYNPPPPVSEAEIARDVPFVPKPKKAKTDQSAADEKQETAEVKENEAVQSEQPAEVNENESAEEVQPQEAPIEETETAQEESAMPDTQETVQAEEAPAEESEALQPEQPAEVNENESAEEVQPQEAIIEETETAQEESTLPDTQETTQAEEAPAEESEVVQPEQPAEVNENESAEEIQPQEAPIEEAETAQEESAMPDTQETVQAEEAAVEESEEVQPEQPVEVNENESAEEVQPQEAPVEETETVQEESALPDQQETAQAEEVPAEESEAAIPEQTAEADENKSAEEVQPQEVSIVEEVETAQEESALPDTQETIQAEEAPAEESEAVQPEQPAEVNENESAEEVKPQEAPIEETETAQEKSALPDQQEAAQTEEAPSEESAIDEDYLAYLENALDFTDE